MIGSESENKSGPRIKRSQQKAASRQKGSILLAKYQGRRPRIYQVFSFTEDFLRLHGFKLEDCIVTSKLGHQQRAEILKKRKRDYYHKNKV